MSLGLTASASTGRMILPAFALALAVLIGAGVLAYSHTLQLLVAGRSVERTHRVLAHLEIVVSLMKDAETARGHGTMGEAEHLTLPGVRRASIASVVQKLRELAADDPEQQRRLEALDSLISAEMVDMDAIRERVREMAAVEEAMLGRRRGESAVHARRTVASVLAVALLGVGLLASVFYFLHLESAERKRAETAARTSEGRTRVLIEAANKDLETFSYAVSHDLRAPLRAIDGFARMLVEEHAHSLDPEAHRLLGVVCENAKSLGRLIDGLLRFSRVVRKDIETSAIDMAALARTVVSEARTHEPSRSVAVTLGSLAPALGDTSMVRQVLSDLLANALKFTRGTPDPLIEIGSTRSGGEQIYFVKDNGAGFDMQHASKLFGVFQRLHRATEFEGTGVGLAIVRRIISRHGGRVWAEGKVNDGATFYFTLPTEEGRGRG